MRRTALAVGMLVPLLALPAAGDPTPTPTPQEPEAPLAVSVTDLLPRAPEAGQAFEVRGAIRNRTTTVTVTDVKVRLARGNVITSRGGLHELEQDGADMTLHSTSREVTSDSGGLHPISTLAPGAVGYFDIRTDVDSLDLRRTGVYPFQVEARGAVDASGLQLLGAVPTWVPFFADPPRQNKVAVVWPVTAPPHQAPDGSFVDDALTSSFAEGSLQHLLYATQLASEVDCGRGAIRNDGVRDPAPTRCLPAPVTFAVDPDLVSAASAMATTSYTYGTGKDRKKGAGRRAASLWLSSLKAQVAASTGSLLALPYADLDVDALATSPAGRDDLNAATALGKTVLESQFGGTPVDAVYPPSQGTGVVSQDAVDALTTSQAGRRFALILDESAFPDLEDEGRTRTPDAPVSLGPSRATFDPVYGLVSDGVLSNLVLGPSSSEEGARLAEQRFIAETAMIAAEAPGLSRTFLIAPDRYSDANVRAATEALRDLGRLPWLCPVALEPATQGRESCPAPRTQGEAQQHNDDTTDPRTVLRQSTDAQLSTAYLEEVATQQRRATQLTTEVLDDSANQSEETRKQIRDLRLTLRQAVARAESSAWRQDPSGQDAELARLRGRVEGLRSNVNVLGGRLLLTSSKGTVQVNVENKLDLPVQIRMRFTFPGRVPVETALISIAGKRSVPAGVKAEGLRSGKFPVYVQMVDRAGKGFRGQAQVQVSSTRYGRLALGVTFAAAGVLFLAAGARIIRRALRRGPPA